MHKGNHNVENQHSLNYCKPQATDDACQNQLLDTPLAFHSDAFQNVITNIHNIVAGKRK